MTSTLRRSAPAFVLSSLLLGSLAAGMPQLVGQAHASYQDEDDTEAPKVEITSPKNGAEVAIGKPLFVTVKATDNTIIKKVHMHINGSEVGAIDGSADVIYRFEVRDIQQGEYTFKAVAVDLAGNEASSGEIKVTGVEKKEEEQPKEDEPKEKDKPGKKKDKPKEEKSKKKSEGDESKKKEKSEEDESKKKEDSEEDESKKKKEESEDDESKKKEDSEKDNSNKKEKSDSDEKNDDSKGGCAVSASRDLGSLSALLVVLLGAGSWRRRRRASR